MISINNVSAGYDKDNYILKDISTSFTSGGICGILGPNGSGKTTLLRVMTGILPYKGSILIKDENDKEQELSHISIKSLARYISLTPQISSIYFSYNIYDTVMMGRYSHSGSFVDMLRGVTAKDREIVEKALDMTGLTDISKKQLYELSGGQLQRVMLARTFAQETPVILLDEPTNHLDIRFHIELMQYLREWCQGTTRIGAVERKNTVISVFHDIGDAAMISDSILLMKNGRIIKKGPTQDILTRDLLMDIFEIDVLGYYENINHMFYAPAK